MSAEAKTSLVAAFLASEAQIAIVQQQIAGRGLSLVWLSAAAELGETRGRKEPPGEHVDGRDGRLFQRIVSWQPVLLLFDLSAEQFPWFEWLPILKSSPATRRIPILAFAPDEAESTRQTALGRGADVVVTETHFLAEAGQLITAAAAIPDHVLLGAACAEEIAPLALEGIALFNQGAYYRCHDALEEAWRQDRSAGRDLYRGILQYGIALYQIERGNFRGATKMLLRLRQWLDPLPAVCRGVHVAALRQNIAVVATAVQTLGAEGLAEFDFTQVAPIEIDSQ